jgi:predicted lysophospholipase L1 biosynthesis ABC-type transport system permease subunit
MAVETALINLAIQILINVIVLSPVFWISGRLLAGKDKAKFTDALWIVVLGTLIGLGFNYFFAESLGSLAGIIASIIMLIIWLGLVKHFFDCGWLKALAISILAVIIFIVIVVLLAIIGIGIALIGF